MSDWPVAVEAVGASPVAVGSLLFRHRGAVRVVIVAKASFDLRPERVLSPRAPMELLSGDRCLDDDASRSVRDASDLAPYKPRVDLTLVGDAWTPGGKPLESMSVRLMFGGSAPLLDRVLNVSGDREPSGAVRAFTRMPIVAERAALSKLNPVGARAPNLVDARDPERAAFFHPIARTWPSRKAYLGARPAPSQRRPSAADYADDFDWRYFQAAPAEQQLDRVQGDEWIVVEGLHPAEPRIRAQLPSAKVKARVLVGGAASASQIVDLALDTIAIDAERMTVSLGYRQSFPVHDETLVARMHVQIAQTRGETPIAWPAPGTPAARTKTTPAVAKARADAVVAEQTADLSSLPPSELAELARLATSPFPRTPERSAEMPPETASLGPEHARAMRGSALPFAPRAPVKTAQSGQTRALSDEEARALRDFAATPFQPGQSAQPPRPAAVTGAGAAPGRSGQTVALSGDELASLVAPTPFQRGDAPASAGVAQPPVQTRAAVALPSPEERSAIAHHPSVVAHERAPAPTGAPASREIPVAVAPSGVVGPAIAPPAPPALAAPPAMAAPPGAAPARPAAAMSIGEAAVAAAALREQQASAGLALGVTPPAPPAPVAPPPEEPDLEAPPGSPRAKVIELLAAGGSLSMLEAANAPLSRLDFSGRSMQNAELGGANLRAAKLDGCDLSGARLHGADLTRASLRGAKLATAELKGAILEGAVFDGAKLEGSSFERATGAGASFAKVTGDDATFTNVVLPKATFSGAALKRADFGRATLEGARIEDAELEGATFEHASLDGASFARAKLRTAVLAKAKGSAVSFEGADLTEADAKRATFTLARFGAAILESASFERADLTGSDLRGASAEGASFAKAKLDDVKRD